jgi:iron complex transport system ATP-binding protein
LLAISHVTVERGDSRLLDDVSLSIEPGQHTAILGRNGSGKSTLVKLITRQIFPTRGQPVRVFGRDSWNVSELRSRLGVVSSAMQLDMTRDEHLEVFETAVSGFFASTGVFAHHAVTNTMKARAEEALEQMGVLRLAGRRLGTLSTGEARRVLIARALVHRPEALLLDEPCAGLDPTTRRDFLESLRQLARGGVTLLLVTHHVEEILPEIDHLVMMRGGRIAREGGKEALMTDAALTDLFEAPGVVTRHGGWYAARLE